MKARNVVSGSPIARWALLFALVNSLVTGCGQAPAARWVREEALAAHGFVEARYDASGERWAPRLKYLPLLSTPDKVYGTTIGSSYQKQGLALSKHFKR